MIATTRISVSFIIPTKNEESMLPTTLESIHRVIDKRLNYEIIVIDNGSSDNTVAIAHTGGAKVSTQNTGTIGSLRNTGATLSSGDYLVFLDADVSITPAWLEPFLNTINLLQDKPYIITGSRCSTSDSAGWIAKSWFRQPPLIRETTHVGTGHMITSKLLFESLTGFDERLQTAEDFDFCTRAKQSGAEVLDNYLLKVIHHGTPETISEFFQREVWHGAGDVRTLRTSLESKVAIMSVVFLIAHLGILVGLLLLPEALSLLVISIVAVIAICLISTWKKYYFAPIQIIFNNTLLYYVYYWGRSISVLNRIIPILEHRSPRAGRAKD